MTWWDEDSGRRGPVKKYAETSRSKPEVDVATVGLPQDNEDVQYYPVVLGIKRSGLTYNFYLIPVSKSGVSYLMNKSGEVFDKDHPLHVTDIDGKKAWDLERSVHDVVGDLYQNYGIKFSSDEIIDAIKADREKYRGAAKGG